LKESQEEILSYEKNKSKSSSGIKVENSDRGEFQFTQELFIKLLMKYLNNSLREIELEYIANFIEFAPIIVDEALSDKLAELSTPELYGKITKDKVQDIIDSYPPG